MIFWLNRYFLGYFIGLVIKAMYENSYITQF